MKHTTQTAHTADIAARRPKPLTATAVLLLLALSTLPFAACGGTATPEEEAAATGTAPAGPADSEVAYEPAYPEEVSDEGLSEEDVEQAAAGEHMHGDGETQDHGDEEGEHDHGEGEHDDDGHQH